MSQDNYKLKDVSGFEGVYAITVDGKIWSYPRKWVAAVKLAHSGKWMKAYIDISGYPLVCLTKDEKRGNRLVHRLVALTYIPNPLNLPEVNHKDGNKQNSNVDNLEWCTPSQNVQHAFDNGLKSAILGENHKRHKLTDNTVKEIRKLYEDGNVPKAILARKYGVSRRLIWLVVNRYIWKHIA